MATPAQLTLQHLRGPRARARRTTLAAVSALVLAPALAACGSGQNAQSNMPYQPAEGVSVRDGDMFALNTLVVSDGEGSGTIVTFIVNKSGQTDTLLSYSVADSNGRRLDGDLVETNGYDIPPQGAVAAPSELELPVTAEGLNPGLFVEVTLDFDRSAPIVVDVPVVPDAGMYATVPLEGASTATSTESAPTESEPTPTEGETTPTEGETTPTEGETTPTEGESTSE